MEMYRFSKKMDGWDLELAIQALPAAVSMDVELGGYALRAQIWSMTPRSQNLEAVYLV